MTLPTNPSFFRPTGTMLLIAAGLLWGAPGNSMAKLMTAADFVPIAQDGFGDRHNSYAWSTRWWNGKLYVGTSRDTYCVQQATIVRFLPELFFLYPPNTDIGFECTDSPQDLPLSGEISGDSARPEDTHAVQPIPPGPELSGSS